MECVRCGLLIIVEILCRLYTDHRRENPRIFSSDCTDPARTIELLLLMTVANIEPPHQFLFLRQAMTATYKSENFIDASVLATRILQKNINAAAGSIVEKTVQQARGVLRAAEERGTNRVNLPFQLAQIDTESAKICGGSLSLIPDGEQFERCSYCGCMHKRVFKGKPCGVCGIGEVGRQVMGVEFRKKF